MDVVLLKSYFVLKTQMLNIVTVCLLIEKILFFVFSLIAHIPLT